MKNNGLFYLSIFLVIGFLGLPLVAQESERIAGTQASLVPPAGFEVATQFPGYIDKESGSSVMVTVIPGPYGEVTGGFTKENMAPRQMELLEKKERKQGELEGSLIHLSQTAGQGTEYLKWIWIFGEEKESVLVTATFPKDQGEEFSKKMRASVESTTWDANLRVDPFEGLTFRIEEAGKFRIAKVVGNMIILSEDAVFPMPEPTAPFVIVGASLSEDWEGPEDLVAFGRQRVKQTQEFLECEIESSEEWAQAGMVGVMVRATGGGADGKRCVQQGLLFSEDGYYILQAFCQEEGGAELRDTFQKIFDSFETVETK